MRRELRRAHCLNEGSLSLFVQLSCAAWFQKFTTDDEHFGRWNHIASAARRILSHYLGQTQKNHPTAKRERFEFVHGNWPPSQPNKQSRLGTRSKRNGVAIV